MADGGVISPVEARNTFEGKFLRKSWQAVFPRPVNGGYPISDEQSPWIYQRLLGAPRRQSSPLWPINKELKASHRVATILWIAIAPIIGWGILASGRCSCLTTNGKAYDLKNVSGLPIRGAIDGLSDRRLDSHRNPAEHMPYAGRSNLCQCCEDYLRPGQGLNLTTSGIDVVLARWAR